MISSDLLEHRVARFPKWSCPYCSSGRLHLVEDKPKIIESKRSISSRDITGDMDIFEAVFVAVLQCDNDLCGTNSIISGDVYSNDNGFDIFDHNFESWHEYRISYFLHSPRIITIPKLTPAMISDQIEKCFDLYWMDLDSCASSIRKCLEMTLSDIGFKKTEKSPNLAKRIKDYITSSANPVDSQIMDAIRLAGNSGTHEDNNNLSSEDVRDLFSLLEYFIDETYRRHQFAIVANRLNEKHERKRTEIRQTKDDVP